MRATLRTRATILHPRTSLTLLLMDMAVKNIIPSNSQFQVPSSTMKRLNGLTISRSRRVEVFIRYIVNLLTQRIYAYAQSLCDMAQPEDREDSAR